VNFVAIEYAMRLEEREKKGKQRLETGIRENWSRDQLKCLALKENI